jgi:hypothetical protein
LPDRPPQTSSAPQRKPEAPPRPRHIADDPLPEPAQPDAGVQQPVTETGLAVEEQVRKEWDPKKNGGLPTPLTTRRA